MTGSDGRPSVELRTLLDLVGPAVRHNAARLWRPQDLRERYLRYLVTMHAVVRASVPLMEFARDRCRGDAAGDDPVRAVLGRYLPAHVERELHHDEWLERDMACAGLDPEQELTRLPPTAVADLVGAQYYWIAHHHPICLLGYIAVLELHAPPPALAGLLAERTGLPAPAFRTLRSHAEIDAEHSTAVLAVLDEAAPPARLRRAVRLSALHTARALMDVLDGLSAPDQDGHHDDGPDDGRRGDDR